LKAIIWEILSLPHSQCSPYPKCLCAFVPGRAPESCTGYALEGARLPRPGPGPL